MSAPTLKNIRTQKRVLVGSSNNLELLGALVEPEPSPAGALNGGGLGVELLLQVFERSEVSIDLVSKGSRSWDLGFLRAGRGKVFPEEL